MTDSSVKDNLPVNLKFHIDLAFIYHIKVNTLPMTIFLNKSQFFILLLKDSQKYI